MLPFWGNCDITAVLDHLEIRGEGHFISHLHQTQELAKNFNSIQIKALLTQKYTVLWLKLTLRKGHYNMIYINESFIQGDLNVT